MLQTRATIVAVRSEAPAKRTTARTASGMNDAVTISQPPVSCSRTVCELGRCP